MTHFGIICPAAIGHLNPMCALGSELQRRGHQVTLFGIVDIQSKVEATELDFYLIGEEQFPLGSLTQYYNKLGKMSGKEGLGYTIQFLVREAQMLFKSLPNAIATTGIEVLIIDQISRAGSTVADKFKLPYVTVCNALLVNREAGVPPYFTSWSYSTAWWNNRRNQLGNYLLGRIAKPITQTIDQQRQEWQLIPYKNYEDAYSPLAQICQLPREFDFPRENLPAHFHYVGLLQNPSGVESIGVKDLEFPWSRLNDKPLVYASLGTLQNKVPKVFQSIAQATRNLDVQLVISLGNINSDPTDYDLPSSAIVVPFAPHQQLINKAQVVVTHAGMNTTLCALSSGVPLVAIPITNEQPGIAARIKRTGAGQVLQLKSLTVEKLEHAITEVLTQDSYRRNTIRMQQAILKAGGLTKAVNIIEQVARTQEPVIAD